MDNSEELLRKETNLRVEAERLVGREKTNYEAINMMLKDEIERMKDEIRRLKEQPPPPPEIKIVESKQIVEPVKMSFSSRADLPGSLREEFDFMLK